MKIYVPQDNTFNKCYVIQSEGVIRAYDTIPNYNTTYNYRDYFVRTDYYYRDGSGTWSNYSNLPTCLASSVITNDFYYRYDLSNILIIFLCLFIFIVYFPLRLFTRFFGRWLRL